METVMITMAIDLCQEICENKIKVNMRNGQVKYLPS